ncbi:ABC transporter (iron.B12.siderophore.hemin), ATP-binding component [Leucobacter sp. 7(1)]|uniref:ABC transporter ATP-binding protein n=1 Tax=Microbacterium sp. TaxID=51671 RepID=UPI00097F3EE7|nr:ABC transporter (iron.B12.siderophore.hemin), ATP-binding component [Leucobacter sp. 7(1)]
MSASVGHGRFAAIIGPNGSGKSTLLNLLSGHHPPHTGDVLIDGTDIAALRGSERSRNIGVLRQDSGPLPDVTVAELIALGPGGLSRSSVLEALERVGLVPLADQPVLTLSGGQRQRALLARAVRHQPSLLVLDEPTNHLDVRHQSMILQVVKEMPMTVVSAVHDLDLAYRYADQVIVLDQGAVVEQGAPGDAMTRGVLRDVFHIDSFVVTTPAGTEHLVHTPLP